MKSKPLLAAGIVIAGWALVLLHADEPKPTAEVLPRAFIDGTGHGWTAMGKDDFEHVNGGPDTWTWQDDGIVRCTGQPVGVIKSKKRYKNLELVLQWRHLRS